MFGLKKYRMLPVQTVTLPSGKRVNLHRIEALVDIPMHNVKAGDLGGYVSGKRTLSHKGNAWIGGSAIAHHVFDSELISDDALVTDNAVVTNKVTGTSKVHGNAFSSLKILGNCDVSGNACLEGEELAIGRLEGNVTVEGNVKIGDAQIKAIASTITISGDVEIDMSSSRSPFKQSWITAGIAQTIDLSGKAHINNVNINGSCIMDGDFAIEECSIDGHTVILDTPTILPGTKFTGTNIISGNSHIPAGSRVHSITMNGGALRVGTQQDEIADNSNAPKQDIESSVVPNEVQEYIDIIMDIEKEYEAYTTDIVKLIKYPAMIDTSISETKEFLYNLRNAKRAIKSGNADKIIELAEKVEKSFLEAENKAHTLVTSHLDTHKKDALKKAGQMFAIAADEASPEPEKRISVKAGLRSLEGIIAVSDDAVTALKVRFGLRELEV